MAKKEFKYRGKTPEELKDMSIEEIAELMPARQKRSLKRGLTQQQKKLLEKAKEKNDEKPIRTHARDMVILPDLFNKKISIHNGKEWDTVEIKPKMIGHYLGEFTLPRLEKVEHSGPGIGATRGTKYISVQ